MKEAVQKKIQYILSYKLNAGKEREYNKLLEFLFVEFLTCLEEVYNPNKEETTSYYNMLLEKLNQNIKSIIIPAPDFCYHPLGFLEFCVPLKGPLSAYKEAGIEVTKEMKEELLKKTFFEYMLKALKNNPEGIGFGQEEKRWKYLEASINEQQAITIARMSRLYKKEYQIVYPDGTKYHYFVYNKCLASQNVLNVNAAAMIEAFLEKDPLFNKELVGDLSILKELDTTYDPILGDLQNDKYGNKVYTASTMLNEFLRRIEKEKNAYKQLEYFKRLNQFLFEMFDYKINLLLTKQNPASLTYLLDELKVLEINMLYNMEPNLHKQMDHVKTLKMMKQKLSTALHQTSGKAEREYTITSLDHQNRNIISASVEPIQEDNQYVLLHILEIRAINNKILVKANMQIINYDTLKTKFYNNIYLSLRELKHLYSKEDLGENSPSSTHIRKAIANRILNPDIMEIIKTERHNFLGEFTYNEEEERCIIYKNKSIEEILTQMK